jgi:peptidoglycan hydrolase-like protein with peptidoglycan-binding domain
MINKIKLISVAGLSLAFVLTFLVSVPSASAYTENITVGADMSLGTTGSNVVVLQGLLSELGYLNVPISIPLGYYGSMTKNAVASYQAAQGVTPTAGYFGSLSKIAMHQHFALHGWTGLLGW